MRDVRCWRCDRQVVAQVVGNVLVIRHRGDRIEVVAANEVTRLCRACGARNRVYPPVEGPLGLIGGRMGRELVGV